MWKMSQSAFAHEFDTTTGKLYTYETGRTPPQRILLEKLAEREGITVEAIERIKLSMRILNEWPHGKEKIEEYIKKIEKEQLAEEELEDMTVKEDVQPFTRNKSNQDSILNLYIDSLQEQKRILEVQNDFLRRNFEISLNSIAEGQQASFAQLRAMGWYQALVANGGDEKKAEAAMAAMSSKAAWFGGIASQEDKIGEGGNSRK